MPDNNKDFDFLLALVKTGTLTVNYEEAMTMLGWNKKKVSNTMYAFRKTYDWPVSKDKAATAPKAPKTKATKRAAASEDGEAEIKKPAAKRVKGKKAAKEEVAEEPEEEVVGDEEEDD